MAFEATTILQLVLLLTWNCPCTVPANQKHPLFAQIITSHIILKEIASATSLVFAPGLFDTLQAAAPPTIAFFKSLPTNTDKRWAIYLLLLEKPGYRPKIYIGSGTNSLRGVSARFSEYNRAEALPQYVQKALDDSYTIAYRGLLCWTAIPPAALQPKIRILFVAMEAAFFYVFWAVKGLKRDYGMSHICHWPCDTLEYNGLCSYCALAEPVSGDFDLTSEQLEAEKLLEPFGLWTRIL